MNKTTIITLLLIFSISYAENDMLTLYGEHDLRSRGEDSSNLRDQCEILSKEKAIEEYVYETYPNHVFTEEDRNLFLSALIPMVQNVEISFTEYLARGGIRIGLNLEISSMIIQNVVLPIIGQLDD
jgi:hypothetical protein